MTLVSPKSSKCNISIGNDPIAFKLYTEVKYLKLQKKLSMTRLTPKLHSLMTLVSPKFLKCNISMNNGPIALKRIWLNRYKGCFCALLVPFLHFRAFSQKLVRNFFSILAWTFPGMVLINYPKLDFKGNFSRSERSKFSKICSVIFLLFWHEASPGWW